MIAYKSWSLFHFNCDGGKIRVSSNSEWNVLEYLYACAKGEIRAVFWGPALEDSNDSW